MEDAFPDSEGFLCTVHIEQKCEDCSTGKIKNNDNRDAIKSHVRLLIDCLALPMKDCMGKVLFVAWAHVYGEVAWDTTMSNVHLTEND